MLTFLLGQAVPPALPTDVPSFLLQSGSTAGVLIAVWLFTRYLHHRDEREERLFTKQVGVLEQMNKALTANTDTVVKLDLFVREKLAAQDRGILQNRPPQA